MISPVSMIPHKSKVYRCIMDLYFQLLLKQKLFESVNAQTNKQRKKQAKTEAMVQLGLALRRWISTMAYHQDHDIPFILSKLDIKYGFWRMAVCDEDACNFWYVLPYLNPVGSIDDIKIVVPNSMQMVWCESPLFFCLAQKQLAMSSQNYSI